MSAGPAEALPGAPGSPTGPAGTEPAAGGGGPGQAGPGSPALRRRRLVRSAAGLLMVAFVLATARLYVFPKRDAPVPADAIVMFAGSAGRLELAVRLARDGYAPVLAVSQPTPRDPCPPDTIPSIEVVCFHPKPLTTQGEARWVGATARARGWRSIIVITSTPQDTRARLRLSRCYGGQVQVMGVDPTTRAEWAYMVTYEWAATVKALTIQRSC